MRHKHTVLLVDDEITDLIIGKNVLSEHYNTYTVPSGEAMFKHMKKAVPDLILLDIEMPGTDGYELIKLLKENPETAEIPIIFLTGAKDPESELKGLALGAVDYIGKPYSPALLLKRIEIHLLEVEQRKRLKQYGKELERAVEQKVNDVIELENTILCTIAGLVERRDDATGGHIERTKRYLRVFLDSIMERGAYADEMKDWDVNLLVLSSQLHDVGKIAIRDEILQKPGKLTTEEFEEIKRHTTFGGEVIEHIQGQTEEHEFLTNAKLLAVNHHERWDGKGYPGGLKGAEIPLQARMMTIVNVYDALVSKRSYKRPFAHEEALHLIGEGKGTEFDPELVELFMEFSERFRDEYKRMEAEQIVMHNDAEDMKSMPRDGDGCPVMDGAEDEAVKEDAAL